MWVSGNADTLYTMAFGYALVQTYMLSIAAIPITFLYFLTIFPVMIREVSHSHYPMGKLPHGSDILKAITDICKQYDIGRIEVIGAVQKHGWAFMTSMKRCTISLTLTGKWRLRPSQATYP